MAPQANKLEKVAATVDAVNAGATTTEAIALALNVVPRQGSYYANAAQELGVLERTNTTPVSWVLTPVGAVFAEANTATRVDMLTELVTTIPAVAARLNGTGEDAEELIGADGYADTTAARRAATTTAWLNDLTNPALAGRLSKARQMVDVNAVKAAESARRSLAPALTVTGELCDSCFIELPATGTCDSCL